MGGTRKKPAKENKEDLAEVSFDFKNIKKLLPFLILGIILVIGVYQRFYHINYPMVGYHNWKSAHYLTEARNFANEGFFKHGFFVPMRDTMERSNEPSDGAHGDTFPTTGIIIGFLFRIFGESLVLARIVNIVFSVGYIIATYLLIRKLFEREDLALLTAFLTAVNPLYVFFSHNIQMDTQGLFFMVLGLYYYVCWIKNQEKFSSLYLASFFIMFASVTKYSFAVAIIPIMITFPYAKFLKDLKKYIKPLAITGFISMMFPAWLYYSQYVIKKTIYEVNIIETQRTTSGIKGLLSSIDLSIVFDSNFWNVMKSYVADNYSLIGMNFAFIGMLVFMFLFLTKNRKEFSYRFTFGTIIGMVAFLFIMGQKLNGHNYHQFPVAPFIIFFISYLFVVIGRNIASFFKDDYVKSIVIALVILIMLFVFPGPEKSVYAQSMQGKDRMFNTQFPGLDVAGYYIRDHSLPNERILHSSHQSFGVLWHAGRKGYKPPNTLEELKENEANFNATYLFAYQWGINSYFGNKEILDYVKQNYRLVQFAYVQNGQQASPLYFVFRKGGTFDDSKLNEILANKPVKKTTYHYTNGPYDIYSIDLE